MNPIIEQWLSVPEPTEEEWLKARFNGLGGTDTAAILGESKWSSPLKVYKAKAEGIDNYKSNLSMERGQYLEPLVAKEFERRTNCKVYANGKRIHRMPNIDFMYGTPDYFYETPNNEVGVLEIKTAAGRGLEKFYNGIPQMYITQAHKYWMIMEQIAQTHIYCSIAIMLDDVVTIEEQTKDADRRNLILETDWEFWHNHILPKIPPKSRDLDDIKLKYANAKSLSVIDLQDDEEGQHYLSLIAKRKQLEQQLKQHYKLAEPYEKEKAEIETEIRRFLKDNETIKYQDKILLTCKNISGKYKLNESKLKEENPELYQQYLNWEVGYRRTSFKNNFIEQAMESSDSE